MKVIITRPEADSARLAVELRNRGHEAFVVPLLRIVPRELERIQPRNHQAICLSSANAVLRPEILRDILGVPVLCVGAQSAAAAKAAGFGAVSSHGGNMDGLVGHVLANLSPAAGSILYLSGSVTSGDMEERLRQHGYNVERLIVYDAIATAPESLPEAVGDAGVVMLYSPRSAKLWREALTAAGLQSQAQVLLHLCLSENVARNLQPDWPQRIAATPDDDAMMLLLDQS